MFDDPRKALLQMEEALFAEEETEETEILEAPVGYADEDLLPEEGILPEDGESGEGIFGRRRKRRNDAVDFHRTVYADEEMDEAAAVFVEKKKRKNQKAKKKKKKNPGCMTLLLLLEVAAIGGLIWWWMQWLS